MKSLICPFRSGECMVSKIRKLPRFGAGTLGSDSAVATETSLREGTPVVGNLFRRHLQVKGSKGSGFPEWKGEGGLRRFKWRTGRKWG